MGLLTYVHNSHTQVMKTRFKSNCWCVPVIVARKRVDILLRQLMDLSSLF